MAKLQNKTDGYLLKEKFVVSSLCCWKKQLAVWLFVTLQWGSVWFLKWSDDADKSQTSQRLNVPWICADIWALSVCHGQYQP